MLVVVDRSCSSSSDSSGACGDGGVRMVMVLLVVPSSDATPVSGGRRIGPASLMLERGNHGSCIELLRPRRSASGQ